MGRGNYTNQATFFLLAPSKVIPVEVFAFKPIRRSHRDDYTLLVRYRKSCPPVGTGWLKISVSALVEGQRSIGATPLDAGDVFTGTGVDSNSVPFFDKTGNIYGGPGFCHDFLGYTGGSIAANCNLGLHNL